MKFAGHLLRYCIPRVSDVLFGAVLLYTSLIAGMKMLGDGDTGYHIRAGELMLQNKAILHADPFSFLTPPLEWTAHEWLAEIIMAICHQWAGLPGVVLLFSLVIAVTNLYLFRMLRERGTGILLTTLTMIIFIAAAKVHWLARPHVFSLFFMLYWYRELERLQDDEPVRLWLLPVSMLLWVNLHGGYIVGIFMIFIYSAGNLATYFLNRHEWENVRGRLLRLGGLLGATVLAALVNPSGYRIFLFPFKLAMDKELMDSVQEFHSPNFHEPLMLKYILLALVAVFAVRRCRVEAVHLFLALFFMNMALFSSRYAPLFALISLPIIVRYLDWDPGDYFPRLATFLRNRESTVATVEEMAKGMLWPVLMTVTVATLIGNGTVSYGFDPKTKPLAALEFLKREHIPGKVFNNDEFGDLMIYQLHGQYKVFIDGRLDMYHSAGVLNEYFKIVYYKPDWEVILNKYGIGWILIDTNSQFARYLEVRNDWKPIYSDQVASIFTRNNATYQHLIEKYPLQTLAKTSNDRKE